MSQRQNGTYWPWTSKRIFSLPNCFHIVLYLYLIHQIASSYCLNLLSVNRLVSLNSTLFHLISSIIWWTEVPRINLKVKQSFFRPLGILQMRAKNLKKISWDIFQILISSSFIKDLVGNLNVVLLLINSFLKMNYLYLGYLTVFDFRRLYVEPGPERALGRREKAKGTTETT